ncbi:MAG: PA2778 family cysteine peptidase [Actinomycetota bacterium]
MRFAPCIAAVLGFGLLTGCAMHNTADAAGTVSRATVAGVPFHPQDGHRCGPAGMAMMLGWSGVTVTPAALEGQFYGDVADPRPRLVDAARRYGRFAYPVAGIDALAAELQAGHPVLILENLGVASRPIWDCVVATGIDGDTVQLNAGTTVGKTMPLHLLDRLWADSDNWGLVVVRAGEMPATAAERPFVEAARGLEKAGRYWEAVLAYDTALSQWPADGDALMGLGSSLYLLGDARGAADSFQAAAGVAKDPKPALEALAHVLAELGRKDEALAAAQKAVSISGSPRHPRAAKGLD